MKALGWVVTFLFCAVALYGFASLLTGDWRMALCSLLVAFSLSALRKLLILRGSARRDTHTL